MEISTLRNPDTLEIPAVKDAIGRWSNIEIWHDALKLQMGVGAAAVVVGTADDIKIDAVSIITLPQAFTDTLPWVVHFHNEGPRDLTHLVVKGTLDFIRKAGYNGFKALNQSGRSDKIWLRAFKNAGKPNFIGSAFLFDINGVNFDASNSSSGSGGRAGNEPVRRWQQQQGRKRHRRQHTVKPARRPNTAVVSAARAAKRRKPR